MNRLFIYLIASLVSVTASAAIAEDLGDIWPICKGWPTKYGLETIYRPEKLTGANAESNLGGLVSRERASHEGEASQIEVNEYRVVQGYLLRYQVERSSDNADSRKIAVKNFCQWLTTNYQPE